MYHYVDIAVQNASNPKICCTCSTVYEKATSKSPSFSFNSTNCEINYDPYIQTESKQHQKKNLNTCWGTSHG